MKTINNECDATNELQRYLLRQEWEKALILLASAEGKEMAKKKCQKGRLALHQALNEHAPDGLIYSLIKAYKKAIMVPGHNRSLPLHCAIHSRASTSVIATLIRSYPQGLDKRNDTGLTPRCYIKNNNDLNSAAIEIISKPTHYWINSNIAEADSKQQASSRADGHDNKLYSQISEQKWNDVLAMLSTQDGKDMVREKGLEGRFPLHIALKKQAPDDIIIKLVGAYKDAVMIQGHNKSLPLHSAVINGASSAIIEMLIRKYPEALDQRNATGRTPRCYIDSGRLDAYAKSLILKPTSYWNHLIRLEDDFWKSSSSSSSVSKRFSSAEKSEKTDASVMTSNTTSSELSASTTNMDNRSEIITLLDDDAEDELLSSSKASYDVPDKNFAASRRRCCSPDDFADDDNNNDIKGTVGRLEEMIISLKETANEMKIRNKILEERLQDFQSTEREKNKKTTATLFFAMIVIVIILSVLFGILASNAANSKAPHQMSYSSCSWRDENI